MGQTPYAGMRIGQYQLIERIWKGTFSESWRGKTIQAKEVIVQFIQHPNLVALLESYPLKPQNIATEYTAELISVYSQPCALVWSCIQGRRLDIYIKNLGKIKESISLYIARKLLEILANLVAAGKTHGALRSTRVIITPNKQVMITNYGLGQLEQILVHQLYLEKKHYEIKNVLPYFAQEVWEDEVFEDPKSDIYSVGIILSEMLLGKLVPHNELLIALQNNGYSPSICNIIQKATTDFEERYNHPQEMYQDLNNLLSRSDQVEKIYVAPPRPSINIALEAIPADSEEYRIYQADVRSAQQSIEAEVVLAESVEILPEELSDSRIARAPKQTTIPIPFMTQRPDELKQTAKFDANKIMIATIDKKILDPLDRESLWPWSIAKYGITILLGLIVLLFSILVLPASEITSVWLLAPFLTLSHWQPILQALMNILFLAGFIFIFFLPIYDPQGKAKYSNVFLFIYGLYFLTWIALAIWGLFI
ncbi:MAG: protein kinase [Planctomycetes bacterium]|jgi:serine/threonine protein kinase|nr:protein kinase [Planctomycetota bacterium]HPY74603.1 protein kinase [Planctomycetota bacterium]HQB00243.1 protein kinase [Planctomycetota bacterium]